jgi:hypothetical protein
VRGVRAARAAGLALGFALALASVAAQAQPLANGDFDAGIEPWVDPFPDASTVIGWSPIDAEEPSASGSLQVETTVTNGAADGPWSECLPAAPGAYTLTAQAFPVSGAATPPLAQVGFEFYPTASCVGDFLASDFASAVALDTWNPLLLETDAPAGTTGLRVRVLVGSTNDSVPDLARFDRIQFVPEPAGATARVAAALSLAALSSGARRSRRPRPRGAPAPPRAAARAAPSGSA